MGCDGRPGSFPTKHALCRLCSRSPNDLLTTWQDFLTLYPRLLFIPDHSRLFWTVQNNREQSGTPRPSSPTSQDLPRPIPVLSRFPYDFTRPLPTIKVGKGRLSGRLSVTGAYHTRCLFFQNVIFLILFPISVIFLFLKLVQYNEYSFSIEDTYGLVLKHQGVVSIQRCPLTSIGNPIVEIRRS